MFSKYFIATGARRSNELISIYSNHKFENTSMNSSLAKFAVLNLGSQLSYEVLTVAVDTGYSVL